MAIVNRATSTLNVFFGEGIGRKPIVFITHSMGGLVVKQILYRAATMGIPTEMAVVEKTRAVVFMSTPHHGADLPVFAQKLSLIFRPTPSLTAMAANDPALLEQATWYRNNAPKMGIQTRSYCEMQKDHGVIVVDQASGDPGVAGSPAVPVDANHSDIPKFASRNSDYKSIKRFVEDALEADPPLARP